MLQKCWINVEESAVAVETSYARLYHALYRTLVHMFIIFSLYRFVVLLDRV